MPSWLRPGQGFPYVPAAILLAVLIAAIGGEHLTPFDPNGLDLGAAFKPPCWLSGGTIEHPLGTDNLGRDIFSRIIAGASMCAGHTDRQGPMQSPRWSLNRSSIAVRRAARTSSESFSTTIPSSACVAHAGASRVRPRIFTTHR